MEAVIAGRAERDGGSAMRSSPSRSRSGERRSDERGGRLLARKYRMKGVDATALGGGVGGGSRAMALGGGGAR
jgi:hypothetical protein